MLPKQFRLKKSNAFSATYRTGVSFHKNGITVFCGRKKCNNSPTKIGFVVSKKIHKRAVKRNRIKRLMRESFRLYIKELNNNYNSKYMSLVFAATTKLLDKNFAEVDYAMQKLIGMLEND